MTVTVCRAKNPAACWMHGNPAAKSLQSLFDPYAARAAVRDATKVAEQAFVSRDIDAFIEAKGEKDLAEVNYDASLYGLSDIDKALYKTYSRDINPDLSYAEKIELQDRKEKALQRREEILETDLHAMKAKKAIAHIIKEHGVHTFSSLDEINKNNAMLNSLPFGTPILVETDNGYFTAQTGGENPEMKRSRWDKALFPNSKFFTRGVGGETLMLLAFTNTYAETTGFKSLTVLSPDFKPSKTLIPYHANQVTKMPTEPGRYGVSGENGFYMEFEGSFNASSGDISMVHPNNDISNTIPIKESKVTGYYIIPTMQVKPKE